MVDTSSAAALCDVRWEGGGGRGEAVIQTQRQMGARSQKKFFWPLGAQFSLKQREGGRPPRAPPLLDPPLNSTLGRCVAL